MKSLVGYLSILYLLLLLGVWGAMHFDTGQTWWVSLFLFSPRWAVGLPWLLLFPLTLVVRFRLAAFYIIHLAILLFPILDFRLPLARSNESQNVAGRVRVVTCNLGEGPIQIERLAELVLRFQADVLVLQECSSQVSQALFQKLGWSYHQEDYLVIASPHPLNSFRLLSKRGMESYNWPVAVEAQFTLRPGIAPIDGRDPAATHLPAVARIACVHLPTFRPAFEKAQDFDASGAQEFTLLAVQYRSYAQETLSVIEQSQHPVIVAGDFNVPVESPFYRNYWSSFQNALSLAGFGLCYTKYTRLHGVRIDHVLADHNWQVCSAEVGPGLGGDHRPVLVELQLSRQ